MITVKDMINTLTEQLEHGNINLSSEIRFVNRGGHTDCSMISQHAIIPAGMKNNTPADRRYGDGTILFAEESILGKADNKVLEQLDFIF